MKRFTQKIFFTLLITITTNSFAQRDYSSNVNEKALEVFKECSQYAAPEYIPTYKEWLSRVEIKPETVKSSETYLKLSSISLRNKCNYELSYQNINFDQTTFNPLKYLLDFETPTQLIYRIDGTDKILLIHPKN